MDPWQFWRQKIASPKLILAPMVDHSELPWRMLSREYDCDAAYTPMFHANQFANSKKYRQRNFSTCHEDRPLFVQFCANNAEDLTAAARYVENDCDGIDLNLGCPQEIARRGRYGAFLQDEWDLINEMVSRLRNNLSTNIAVSCKVRRFDSLDKTLDYARLLERAGCTFVGIHGRTREQRGTNTGLADWSYIKAVKANLTIPVIANGNVQSLRDAKACLEYTNADAVMTAEGNLHNPALFRNIHPPAWEIAFKYLDCVKKYPIPAGMAKSHIFKLFHRCLGIEDNYQLREQLGRSNSLAQLHEVVEKFKEKYYLPGESQTVLITRQPVPPYLCQPCFRYDLKSSSPTLEPNKNLLSSVSLDDNVDCLSKRIKLNACG